MENTYVFLKDHQLAPSFLSSNFYKLNYSLGNPEVKYWVVLPNNVKELSTEEIKIDLLNVNLVGHYTSNSKLFFDVEVFYEHIKFDINPFDWIIRKISKLKETVLFADQIREKSTGIYADILTYNETLGGDKFISRITVKKNFDYKIGGANYVAIRVMCREEDYNNQADFVLHTAYNWDFKDKGDWQLAERLVPIDLKLKEKLSFFVFESWEVFGEGTDKLNSIILRQNRNKLNKGVINIFHAQATDSSGVTDLMSSFVERFKSTTVKMEEITDVSTIILNPIIKNAWTTTGVLENSEDKLKLYFESYIIQLDNATYYLESLGSHANFENLNWEINKRQLEMIIDSFNNKSFEQNRNKVAPKKPTGKVESPVAETKKPTDFSSGSMFFK